MINSGFCFWSDSGQPPQRGRIRQPRAQPTNVGGALGRSRCEKGSPNGVRFIEHPTNITGHAPIGAPSFVVFAPRAPLALPTSPWAIEFCPLGADDATLRGVGFRASPRHENSWFPFSLSKIGFSSAHLMRTVILFRSLAASSCWRILNVATHYSRLACRLRRVFCRQSSPITSASCSTRGFAGSSVAARRIPQRINRAQTAKLRRKPRAALLMPSAVQPAFFTLSTILP